MTNEKTLGDATVDELLAELEARCPASVIAANEPDDGNVSSTIGYTWGNRIMCLGLAHMLVDRVMSGIRKA